MFNGTTLSRNYSDEIIKTDIYDKKCLFTDTHIIRQGINIFVFLLHSVKLKFVQVTRIINCRNPILYTIHLYLSQYKNAML